MPPATLQMWTAWPRLLMLTDWTLAELVKSMKSPRALWLMVPAGAVDSVVRELSGLLERGDPVAQGVPVHAELLRRISPHLEKMCFIDL